MTIDNLEIEIKSSSEKASTGIDKLRNSLKKLNNTSTRSKSGLSTLNTELKKINLTAKLGAIAVVANRTGNALANVITKSNAYVENLNLFTVSLGEFASEAKQYAEEVGEVMGIDPSDWLRAQGIFNTLATGFGVSAEKASIMSKNLTQLSYDISSLYNIRVADAMTKLQSAFSGELEPVRRLGYDLSQTKLQMIATTLGIEKQVSEMTQAEKSMIRYYALMTQVTEAQGDMGRTLETPANQLRIFNAQIEQMNRALGNIFIPLLNKVLPYMIAFTKVIRDIANNMAVFFGFELPEIDYSSVNNLGSATGDLKDELDDANTSAKKLKNTIGGFDELNILSDGSDGNGLNGIDFDIDLPEYDFLGSAVESKFNSIYNDMKNNIEPITKLLQGFASGVSSVLGLLKNFVGTPFMNWLEDLGQWAEENPNTMWMIGYGLGAIATGLVTIKTVGSIATLLRLPALLKSVADYSMLVYAVNGRKLIPTIITLGTKLAGVGLILLGVYEGFKLVKSIIDIKQGTIDGWEAVREVVGRLALTIGLVGLGLTALGVVSAGVVSGILIGIGLIATHWNDFIMGLKITAMYFVKYVGGTIYSAVEVVANTAYGLWFGFKEIILSAVWTVANSVEKVLNASLSNVRTFAKVVDKVAGTNLAEKLDVDLTSSIEKEMQKAVDILDEKSTASAQRIKEAFSWDVWETDFIKDALDDYEQTFMYNEKEQSGVESLSTELKALYDNFKAGNDEQKAQLDSLNQQQIELKQQQEETSIQELEKLETANILNEEMKNLQDNLNQSQIASNEIQNQKLPELTNLLQSTRDTLASKLDAVEDACRNIRINITKVYGSDEYASGGFPTTGQLFVAREAGAELVGNIGGRTAVANNDQITEGIAQAVYSAMMSANQGGGESNINVFLDGRQINASVEKVKKEKGTSIMTGGLIYG